MAEPKTTDKITLPAEEIEKEKMLQYIVERQAKDPNPANLASLFNALKDAAVYVPVAYRMPEEARKQIAQDIMEGRQPDSSKISFVPQYLIHRKTGEKCLPFFTRQEEFERSQAAKGISFIRISCVQMINICDQIQDAFGIMLDPYSYGLKFSLDEFMDGLNGNVPGANILNDEYQELL